MDKKEKIIITVTAALLAVALIVTAIVFFVQKKKNDFTPPPFDKGAISGKPAVDNDEFQYRTVTVSENLSFSLCMCPLYEAGMADIFLTNDGSSNAYIRIVLFDTEGNLIGESGLVRPGEYIESVSLSISYEKDTAVKAKILTYDRKNYYSMGTSDGELNLIIDK